MLLFLNALGIFPQYPGAHEKNIYGEKKNPPCRPLKPTFIAKSKPNLLSEKKKSEFIF